jgi:hypothetical protein
MKVTRYIILGVILISLIISSFPHVANGYTTQTQDKRMEAVDPAVSFGFFETYAWTEVLSGLDPTDRFFSLIDSEGVDKDACKLGTCTMFNSPELWDYIHSDPFAEKVPEDIRFAWGAKKDQQDLELFALKQPAGPSKGPDLSQIQDVTVKKSDQGETYDLFITFSEEGAKLWATLTGENVGRSVAIVFNDLVYTAPKVQAAVKHGKCVISGDLSERDVIEIRAILDQ